MMWGLLNRRKRPLFCLQWFCLLILLFVTINPCLGRRGGTYIQNPRNYPPYRWNIDAQHENYTTGIVVQPTNEFSIWDFSGFEPYYCFYDHFIGDTSCIHLILFSLLDKPEWRRSSVKFWLDFLYARIPINGPLLFGGRPVQAAHVVLVATHADCVPCQRDANGLYTDEGAINLGLEMRNEYKYKLDIHETIYILDTRDATSLELKQMKIHLAEYQNLILQMLPRTNSLLLEVANQLTEWTKDNSFPVDNIEQFAARIHEHVNPLCTDEHLSSLIQHLQYTGNIIYIESRSGDDMIVLEPNFLCSICLGQCFSEHSLHRLRITGSYTLDDLQLVVRVQNTVKMVNLLESLELIVCCVVHEKHMRSKTKKKQQTKDCFEQFEQASGAAKSIDGDPCHHKSTFVSTQFVFDINKLDQLDASMEVQIEMPRLNLIPMYDALWDQNCSQNMRYIGVRISSTPGQFIHLLPRFHTHLRRKVSALPDINNQVNPSSLNSDLRWDKLMEKFANSQQRWDLVLCIHGSKVTGYKGDIEMLVNVDEKNQDVWIRVRCTSRHVRRAFRLLHDTVHLICLVIQQSCPSLEFHINLLSSSELKNHRSNPSTWDPIMLTKALFELFNKSASSEPKSNLSGYQTINRSIEITGCSTLRPEFNLIQDLFLGDEQLAQECSTCLDVPAYTFNTSLYHKLISLIDLDERNADKFIKLAESLCYPDVQGLLQQWRHGNYIQGTLSPTASLLNYAAKYSTGTLAWALQSTYGWGALSYLFHRYALSSAPPTNQTFWKHQTRVSPLLWAHHPLLNQFQCTLISRQAQVTRLFHATSITQSQNEELKSPVNAWTEWDPLEEVIIGIPDNAIVPKLYPEVKACTPRSEHDFYTQNAGKYWADSIPKEHWDLLRKQVDEFVRVLELEGVKVVRPDAIDHTKSFKILDIESQGFYNAMPRDFLLVVGDELIESTMTWRSRYFEFTAYRSLIMDYWKRGAKWTVAPKPTNYDKLIDKNVEKQLDTPNKTFSTITTESEPCFDAADFIRAGRDLFVQRSQVTNLAGIEWVRRHLKPLGINVHRLTFDDPRPMHIDATFVLVKPGLAFQNPDRPCHQAEMLRKAGWDVYDAPYPIVKPDHKFWLGSPWLSMNTLMLDSKRVIVEAGEPPLLAFYEKFGIKTIPIHFRYANSIGGGFHCWSSDIRRKGSLQSYFDWSKVQLPMV